MLKTDAVTNAGSPESSDILSRFGFAQTVAREAGQRAREFFETRDTLTVESKGPQDRVTIADRQVQDHIQSAISQSFPDDEFLGEETTAGPQVDATGRNVWVVDPIDGTDCFVFGLPTWCVSISYVRDGTIQLGAIFDPVHDEMFACARGHGAFLNGSELKISDARQFGDGLVGIGHSARVEPDISLAALERLTKSGGMFHRCGSGALSLAWVAAGRLIGYFESHMNSWDCLAGLLLVREAGGWTNDFLEDDGLLSGNLVIAAAPGMIDQLKYVAGQKPTGGQNTTKPDTG